MRILLADDDDLCRESLSDYLVDQLSHQVTQCNNGREALELFQRNPFPLVLADIRMPSLDGIDLLHELKALPQSGSSDIVIVTGYGSLSTSIDALRAGAYDYLLKPINLLELKALVGRVAEHQSLIMENQELTRHFQEKVAEATQETESKLRQIQKAYAETVGPGRIGIFSQRMCEVIALAEHLHEDRSVPVLIEGETGTGKEVVARLIHYGHGEETSNFVSINCSAIPPGLFESELFGYEGGAYTGARKKGSQGKLELAQGGTLFLDEIGDLPLELQPKLLRFFQEREIYRVGGLKKIKLDVRIICSTNRNLARMVDEGLFRRDLFFRLNLGWIYVPPLRQRREAIKPLAQMFLKQFTEEKKRRFKSIQQQTVEILENHQWPGNVRELQNAIERVVLLYDDVEIRPEHLRFLTAGDMDYSTPRHPEGIRHSLVIIFTKDAMDLKAVEKSIIEKALQMFEGNKTRTAAFFGISRNALLRKIKRS
ncbi:MAG TPA: sigma-54 dependent transcriptional regulator [archaeon]|nr:sigma-54 dependent transcriptional regulator [archaeon]